MILRFFLFLASTISWLTILAVVLLTFRIDIAQALATSRLEALGISKMRFSIKALDLYHLEVKNIEFDNVDVVAADRVVIAYTPRGLIAGQLGDIAIDGLHLKLDLTSSKPAFGGLPFQPPGTGTGASEPPVPRSVTLTNGRLEAMVPAGPIKARVDGHWQPGGTGATVSLTEFDVPNVTLETARVDLEATEERLVATVDIRDRDGALVIDLRAVADDYMSNPIVELTFESLLSPAIWQGLPQGTEGSIELSGRIGGRIGRAPADGSQTDWMDRLMAAQIAGQVRASLNDISYGKRLSGISGDLGFDLAAGDGSVGIRLADTGSIQVARIDPEIFDANGLASVASGFTGVGVKIALPSGPESMRFKLRRTDKGSELTVSGTVKANAGEMSAELQTDGQIGFDQSFSVRQVSFPRTSLEFRDFPVADNRFERLSVGGSVTGSPGDLVGAAEATAHVTNARAGNLTAAAIDLNLNTSFSWRDRRLAVHQTGEGMVSATSLRLGRTMRVARTVSVALEAGKMALDLTPDGPVLSHNLNLRPKPASIVLQRPAGKPLAIWADPRALQLTGRMEPGTPYQSNIEMPRGYFAIPDKEIAIEAVSASLTIPPRDPFARFTVRRLRHTATLPDFPTLRLDGSVRRQRDRYDIKAAGVAANGALRFNAKGQHKLTTGRGKLRFNIPETPLGEGALQPAELFPQLPAVKNVTGAAGATVALAWGPNGLTSGGSLKLSNLSFLLDGTNVTGLTTQITLGSLMPLSTGPGQRITIRRLDPAVPLDEVAIQFQAVPARRSKIRLEAATARFSGGRLNIAGTDFDSTASTQIMTVGVDRVDLESLLKLLKVEDVSGTGRLSGTLPLTVTGGRVALSGGQLATEGPGVLHIRSKAAAAALGGSGEQVELMLSALEDFRYDTLTATLDMGLDGEASFMIRLKGHNPAVLDGYPFAFNIGLSGNLAKLLGALRQGAKLSTDLIRPQIR